MVDRKLTSIAVILAAGLVATAADAQQAPPNLIDFVTNEANGATELQQSAGIAVQRTCAALAAAGGFSLNDPQQQDLFLRCNEFVQTSQELQGFPDTDRSLGIESGELLAAIQQVSGEELHSQSTLATRVTNGQFSNIAGRLNSLRVGSAGVAGSRVAYADPQSNEQLVSASSNGFALSGGGRRGGGASADVAGSRLGWFLDGSYNTGNRDHSANEDGFDFDATSVTIGLDWSHNSGVIGFSAGLDTYDADFDTILDGGGEVVSGGNVEVEGTTGSIFAAWYLGNFYIDAIVSFGSLDSDISRNLVYASNNPMCAPACPSQARALSGETDGDFTTGGFTSGYDAMWGNWDVSTTLSLNYRDIDIDSYDETDSDPNGGLALRYAPQTIESFRSILGLAFSRNISRGFGVLVPQFRVEWHHEFEDDPLTLAAKFVAEDGFPNGSAPDNFSTAACISCFRFSTDEIDTDFALVGASVSMVFARRLQIYGAYDALLGLDNLTSNTLSLGIRGQF
jgi:outer membrane autotransporter protein